MTDLIEAIAWWGMDQATAHGPAIARWSVRGAVFGAVLFAAGLVGIRRARARL